MSETSPGNGPPDNPNQGEAQLIPSNSARGVNQGDRTSRRSRRKARGPAKETKFKGKCESIEEHVYDVGMPRSSQDLFTSTTKEIAEYVAREYHNAGEYRLIN